MASTEPPALPESALEEKFLAATGPGGQNVNKVATACQLRLDVYALRLAPDIFDRLKLLAGSRWSQGSILVTARRFRTREANREDARHRLAEMVAQAHIRPERRVKTKPSKAAKARRVETKAQRGTIKQGRARPQID
ncbi:alternative ribosome rescue aminoacyl-tRNA hydrolase ArfB [Sphingomonas sp. BIUV-7]|uniref:Alternative ribosome rescue aminoacyl-tRNA hydrolase ArfB n=1 Tax=Sphingomonas natans TaxID=3063330 RepID=A0ABT8Y6G9_9SPHN|nr:alternative ribosome rescue aminoacyl-tRNA hydrolase ArfB [Sphingomonas sp. BIUV-7]MDO6413917.1 alternative ribosome rescue aminoacyl-tRNA hydrolase ArfB [Sphingomonas sp. BIUV-7]